MLRTTIELLVRSSWPLLLVASVVTVTALGKPACACASAPSATLTEPPANASGFAATTVPAETVVPPVWVLAPASVHVPVPAFVSPPVPFTLPANVVELLSPPVVSVPAPRATALPATPDNDPIVWMLPPRSSVAPLAGMLTAAAAGRYCLPCTGEKALVL